MLHANLPNPEQILVGLVIANPELAIKALRDINPNECHPAHYSIIQFVAEQPPEAKEEAILLATMKLPLDQQTVAMSAANAACRYNKSNYIDLVDAIRNLAGQKTLNMAIAESHAAIQNNQQSEGISSIISAVETVQARMNIERWDLSNCIDKMVERRLAIVRGEVSPGATFGIRGLDGLSCIRDGELIYICGRPAIGKTSFLLSVVNHRLLAGDRGLFVSAEMPADQLLERMVSGMSGVNLKNLEPGEDVDAQVKGYLETAEFLKTRDLRILDTTAPIEEICNTIRGDHREKPFDWIAVDYLQILSTISKGETGERIRAISSQLRKLAKDLNIPVLCAAQLNRKSTDAERPKVSHIEWCGAAEQDASTIILLHRAKDSTGECAEGVDENGYRIQPTEVLVGKQRFGRTGMTAADFRPETVSFHSASPISPDIIQRFAELGSKPGYAAGIKRAAF